MGKQLLRLGKLSIFSFVPSLLKLRSNLHVVEHNEHLGPLHIRKFALI
jgi:hypothetical protein